MGQMKWFNVRNVGGGLLKNKMLVKKDVYLNPRQSSDVFVVSNVNYICVHNEFTCQQMDYLPWDVVTAFPQGGAVH